VPVYSPESPRSDIDIDTVWVNIEGAIPVDDGVSDDNYLICGVETGPNGQVRFVNRPFNPRAFPVNSTDPEEKARNAQMWKLAWYAYFSRSPPSCAHSPVGGPGSSAAAATVERLTRL